MFQRRPRTVEPAENKNFEGEHGRHAQEQESSVSTFEWEIERDPNSGRFRIERLDGARQLPSLDDSVLGQEPERNPSQAKHETGLEAKPPRQQARIHYQLDAALEIWWEFGRLPPQALLRDGLLVLEGGEELDDAQRSLLLRAALAYGHGVLTALNHQRDAELTAVAIGDALFDPLNPLGNDALVWLLGKDPRSAVWADELAHQLQDEAVTASEPHRSRVREVLAILQPVSPPISRNYLLYPRTGFEHAPLRTFGLAVVAVGLIIAASWLVVNRRDNALGELVILPSGAYIVSGPNAEEPKIVELTTFVAQRTEVTNSAYRQCAERGVCQWPDGFDSATRSDYFLDRDYAIFPVVNVSWLDATAYCQWAGMRLPTAAEWEVAASAAPATDRRFAYPWGDHFELQFANSAESQIGDTKPVGSYHPTGDSPLGLSDMAGNVAEWTATPGREAGVYVVKGGSFRDAPDELLTARQRVISGETHANWIGFRCVRTVSSGSQ